MCTSHIAGNTQWLLSMGKIRKSKGMCGINAIARYDKDVVDVTVLGDDETLAKLSRGDDEVEPYLDDGDTKMIWRLPSKVSR